MAEYEPNCSLCQKEPLAEQPYHDEVCWVTFCPNLNCPQRGSSMIVLNAHRPEPTLAEREHIKQVKDRLYPNLNFRGYMTSMPQHWHDHLM